MRKCTVCFILLLLIALTAAALSEADHTELSPYFGQPLEAFQQILPDRAEDDDMLAAATEDYNVYASLSDAGTIDYICLQEEDKGYCVCGIYIGMAREEALNVLTQGGFTAYDPEYDTEDLIIMNSEDLTVAVSATFFEGACDSIAVQTE